MGLAAKDVSTSTPLTSRSHRRAGRASVGDVAIRVAAFELPARWNEPVPALADVERLLAEGGAADLVLLPETSLTVMPTASE